MKKLILTFGLILTLVGCGSSVQKDSRNLDKWHTITDPATGARIRCLESNEGSGAPTRVCYRLLEGETVEND